MLVGAQGGAETRGMMPLGMQPTPLWGFWRRAQVVRASSPLRFVDVATRGLQVRVARHLLYRPQRPLLCHLMGGEAVG